MVSMKQDVGRGAEMEECAAWFLLALCQRARGDRRAYKAFPSITTQHHLVVIESKIVNPFSVKISKRWQAGPEIAADVWRTEQTNGERLNGVSNSVPLRLICEMPSDARMVINTPGAHCSEGLVRATPQVSALPDACTVPNKSFSVLVPVSSAGAKANQFPY